MYKHILTATDGSDWAFKGVDVALNMAAWFGAKLTVLHASDIYPDYMYADGLVSVIEAENTRQAMQSRADDIFEKIADIAKTRNVYPEFVYVAGSSPAAAIDAKAEQLGCDLIVIGSRGRRGLTKLFLGSQAAEVLAATHLPVLIVK